MTCIVGFEHEGSVWMGGDAQAIKSESMQRMLLRYPKVFENGSMLFGIAGDPRLGQILQYGLTVPDHPEGKSTQAWMATDFADAVRDAARRAGYMRTRDGADEGGYFLAAHRGELYRVEADFVALRAARGFEALGTGEPYALAVMTVNDDRDPFERVQQALTVAAALNAGVSPPFTIIRGANVVSGTDRCEMCGREMRARGICVPCSVPGSEVG